MLPATSIAAVVVSIKIVVDGSIMFIFSIPTVVIANVLTIVAFNASTIVAVVENASAGCQ
jgi:hypothetical protein